MNSQPDKEVHRMRSGRVLRAKPLSPWSWGRMRCVTLPVCRCVHQPGDSLDHILLGFYGGLIVWA